MIKILLSVIAVLFFATSASADTIKINKINLPDAKAGIYYDFEEKQIDQTTTMTVVKIPTKAGSLDIDAGYTIQNKILCGISYRLGNLEKLGLEVPLLKFLDVSLGIAGSYHYERDDLGFGLYGTLVRVEF